MEEMVRIYRVKIFGGNKKSSNLEKDINKWLKNNSGSKVVDIKYGYSADGSVGWHSAMVIFETEDIGLL